MSCDIGYGDTYEIKRGATFTADCVWKDSAGVPINLSNPVPIAISSSVVKMSGDLVANLSVVIRNQVTDPGKFALFANTENWPEETLNWDIRFDEAGSVTYSPTRKVKVISRVTED